MRDRHIATTLLVVAAVLSLEACGESTAPVARRAPATLRRDGQPTVGERPSRDVAFAGRAADSALRAIAAAWARQGNRSLADHIAARDAGRAPLHAEALVSADEPPEPEAGRDRRAPRTAAIVQSSDISPTSRPYASIASSGTTVYVNGTSGVVSSNVIYYGNMARNDVTYWQASDDGSYVPPQATNTKIGEGAPYPCVGSIWVCSFTFQLETVISVSLSKPCGITLGAFARHAAWWQAPALAGYLAGASWGHAYSDDAPTSRSNGQCAPPTGLACRATTSNTTLFSPTLDPGGFEVPCTEAGAGTLGGGSACGLEYIYVEQNINGVWRVIWEGWATVCR